MSRLAVRAALLPALCLLVLNAEPARAQDKKDTKIANLEKQLAALQQQNAALKQEVAALKTANTQLQAALKKQTLPDPNVKTLQAAIDAYRHAGLVHVVILTLKSDSSEGEIQSLIDDAYSQLSTIKTVRGAWAGKPSGKGTPDGVSDYTVALVMAFDDAAGLKAYLNDPVHTKFADRHLKKWETPTVYDFEPKPPTAPPVDPTTLNAKTLQSTLDGYRGAGLVHVVTMKLKPDTSAGETQALIDAAYSQLPRIKAVRGLWVGKPAAKGSPNANADYNVAVVVLFDDAAGLKSFLNDPIHMKYTTGHIKKWEPAVVYDFEPKQPSP
jgi:hypothetical protein